MYNPYGISYAGILGYQYLTPSGVISERLNIGAQINLIFAFLPAKAYRYFTPSGVISERLNIGRTIIYVVFFVP